MYKIFKTFGKNVFILLLILILPFIVKGQEDVNIQKAHDALELLKTVKPVPVVRTNNPDAQWFPDAGFGLFMHWGIHSVAAIEPSWAMMKNLPWRKGTKVEKEDSLYLDRAYYSLLWQFHPENYDPDKWIKAAKDAGMTYAVLTSKHHDGYKLWPSEYGHLSTKQYLEGRDLLKPYVDACRKYGLKVGLYFSPRDWSYPGYPVSMDWNNRYINPETGEQARYNFEKFFEYTTGQLSEILTRYGKIDILWFDGMGWDKIKDVHAELIYAWVRKLQPGIIINNRWDSHGDFSTPETFVPEKAPEGWWESCLQWGKHWGYSPGPTLKSDSWVMEKLVLARSLGGNILLNIGPAPDGTMQPEYYEHTADLARWMTHSKKSLIGAGPVKNWKEICNVPITRKDKEWYLHLLPGKQQELRLKTDLKPVSVKLLQTNESVKYRRKGNSILFDLPNISNGLDDVIVITWKEAPKDQ
jgi:alpha-L-fucosidase